MLNKVKKFLQDENGASAVEYGLIVGLIAVAIVAVLGVMGGGLKALFTSVSAAVSGADTAAPATR